VLLTFDITSKVTPINFSMRFLVIFWCPWRMD